MTPYQFHSEDFALSKAGIHLIRNKFNFETIDYDEVTKAHIRREAEIKRPTIILCLGIAMIFFAVRQALWAWGLFSIVMPVIAGALGIYCVYSALKKGPVLKIVAGNKIYKLRLRSIIKGNQYPGLANYLETKLGSKLNIMNDETLPVRVIQVHSPLPNLFCRLETDIPEAKWIAEGLAPSFATKGWFAIGDCIPGGFEAYAKIFHPFGQDGVSLTWKTVADRYGIVFDNETNITHYGKAVKEKGDTNELAFPEEGRMPLTVLSTLLDVLRPFTAQEKVCIFQTMPHYCFGGSGAEAFVDTHIDEVLSYFENYFIGYLYAADRSWIIFTDTDFEYTMIAGPAQLIRQLMESSLEVLPCEVGTQISYDRW
jgi:hypothetical protein